jgi:hypothetical protein
VSISYFLEYILDHEVWWINGYLHKRNMKTDTKDKVSKLISAIMSDVNSRNVVGAYVHMLQESPILFVHAGISSAFYKYMQREMYPKDPSKKIPASAAAEYINTVVLQAISGCKKFPCPEFTHELFEAGPDRGGKGIGGPLYVLWFVDCSLRSIFFYQ